MKLIFLLAIIFVMSANTCFAQDWIKLVALESTREEVEKILGKPDKYFDTYGSYRTRAGKFSVWYSTGECRKDIEGRQYKVPANLMTALTVFLEGGLPLRESVITNLNEYTRQKLPDGSERRYLYVSRDESIIYQTIVYLNSRERVESISIEPSKEKQHLLCKNNN